MSPATVGAATHVTRSAQETEAVAAQMAAQLQAGDVILLHGELGAGKTAFVRGLAAGLGIDPEEVSSPTFMLLHEYRGGRLTLHHADLYRLDGASAEDVGLQDPSMAAGVLAIEWPERLSHRLAGARTVLLEVIDEKTRRIRIIA